MQFSIVITTYNRLSLLKRAINSALSQTECCEIIVVDDHSSDETADYLKNLEGIKFWRNPRNLGHSASINKAVELAQGEWIKTLDDDDYLAPNCLETFKKAIALHPQAVIISCQAFQVTMNEQEIFTTFKPGPGEIFYIPQADIHYGMLLDQVPFGTTTQVAFRKDAFQKSGGWNPEYGNVCDEIDAWIRIAQFGDAIFINSCLVYRLRWFGGYNKTYSLQKRMAINVLMKEKIYKLIPPEHQAYTPSIQSIEEYIKLYWLLITLKEKQISLNFLQTVLKSLFSLKAWQILIVSVLSRYNHRFLNPRIHKIVLK